MDFFVHRRCGVLADRLAARAERLLETHVSYASREARSSDARSVLAEIRTTLEELERLAPAFLAADGFRAKLNGAEATTNKWLAEASATTTDALEEITVSPETRSLFRARLTETCAMLREGSGKGSRADMFAEQAVLRSDVVFATLSSSGQAILSRADNFDALVVDEAAQALECELVVALARKPKRCLLVGDPAQLPATMASDAARRQGHDRSCMRRLLDAAAEDASRASHASHASHDSWYTLLDTQYRMHPAISSFPSRRFYESSVRDAGSTQTVPFFLLPERVSTRDKAVRLERTGRVRRDDDHANARVTKKREALRSWLRAPFAFVDVPFAAGSRSETRGSSFARGGANAAASLGNDAEAELAAALARALPWALGGANDATRRDAFERFERSSSAASSVARADSDSDSSFPDSSSDDATRRIDVAPSATRITSAVITFYSEQVRRLRRELEARESLANALAGPHEISCGSVPRRAKETKETFSAKRRKTSSKTKTPPKTSREDHFRQRDSSRFPPPAVHTVDSFQGSEADVVVISAVRCNARGDVGFLADPRRLNVALTRAKSACVFVGCVRTLRASGSADLRALVRDAERRGLIATEAEARAWLELHK
jgi:senataxin